MSVHVVARRIGLSPRTIRRYIEEGLVGEVLTDAELPELRRIRRLRDLGVNVAGIEIILNMRCQIVGLRGEVARLERILVSMK